VECGPFAAAVAIPAAVRSALAVSLAELISAAATTAIEVNPALAGSKFKTTAETASAEIKSERTKEEKGRL
jgi:ABC-type phosphate/phosphonate transport system permease subunit